MLFGDRSEANFIICDRVRADAVRAFGLEGTSSRAFCLLKTTQKEEVLSNVLCYSATISPCEKGEDSRV